MHILSSIEKAQQNGQTRLDFEHEQCHDRGLEIKNAASRISILAWLKAVANGKLHRGCQLPSSYAQQYYSTTSQDVNALRSIKSLT